jgi:endoglucanase
MQYLVDQPMMIAEFGSSEFQFEGLDKAVYIIDASDKIKTDHPRVKIVTWFNVNKELDWRVNLSPKALEAFKVAMKDLYYTGSPSN